VGVRGAALPRIRHRNYEIVYSGKQPSNFCSRFEGGLRYHRNKPTGRCLCIYCPKMGKCGETPHFWPKKAEKRLPVAIIQVDCLPFLLPECRAASFPPPALAKWCWLHAVSPADESEGARFSHGRRTQDLVATRAPCPALARTRNAASAEGSGVSTDPLPP
jgi:hypothetical protein